MLYDKNSKIHARFSSTLARESLIIKPFLDGNSLLGQGASLYFPMKYTKRLTGKQLC